MAEPSPFENLICQIIREENTAGFQALLQVFGVGGAADDAVDGVDVIGG